MKPVAIVDVESRSPLSLPDVGFDNYAAHPATRVLSVVALCDDACRVWVCSAEFPGAAGMPRTGRLDVPAAYGDPGRVVVDFCDDPPAWLASLAESHVWVGHNAYGFDSPFVARKLGLYPEWFDTLPLARAVGLPGALDAIGEVLIGVGKHEGGKDLARFYDASRGWNVAQKVYPHLWSLVSYNVCDCLLTRALFAELLPYVDDCETELIDLDQRINRRGVRVDTALRSMIEDASIRAIEDAGCEIERISSLRRSDLRSVPKMRDWLTSQGFNVPDMRKETLNKLIGDPDAYFVGDAELGVDVGSVSPTVARVLRLRKAATRATGGKVERIAGRLDADARLRGMLVYHGAHTGRFSSRVVQIHNLNRGARGVDAPRLLANGVPTYDDVAAEAQRAGVTVDDVLATLLRYVFCAAPGHRLGIVDYAAIEARGLAWVAGEQKLLDAFRANRDVYCEFGARLFGRPITKKDEDERQISKVTVLGAGYGLGHEKFAFYAANAGVDLARVGVTARQCIESYRDAYPAIAGVRHGDYRRGGVWRDLSDATFAALRGETTSVAKCVVGMHGPHLLIQLPSGRELFYRDAAIEDVVPRWGGEPRPAVTYRHQHGYRKQLYGGLLTENVVQAICRDVLCDAMLKLDALGLPIVLHVHDEIVTEVPELQADAALATMFDVMRAGPSWAAGFPIEVEGFVSRRYGKKPT